MYNSVTQALIQTFPVYNVNNTSSVPYLPYVSHQDLLQHIALQVDAHSVGCTAVSWSPAAPPGSLVSGKPPAHAIARFATAGCDRTVRVGLLPVFPIP